MDYESKLKHYLKLKKDAIECQNSSMRCLFLFVAYALFSVFIGLSLEGFLPLIFLLGFYYGSFSSDRRFQKLCDFLDDEINQNPEFLKHYLSFNPKFQEPMPYRLIRWLEQKVKRDESHVNTSPSYKWVCSACSHTNQENSDTCNKCGCPHLVSLKELEDYKT